MQQTRAESLQEDISNDIQYIFVHNTVSQILVKKCTTAPHYPWNEGAIVHKINIIPPPQK